MLSYSLLKHHCWIQKAIRLDDEGAIFSDKCFPELSRNEVGGQTSTPMSISQLFQVWGEGGVGGGFEVHLVLRNIYTHMNTHIIEKGNFHAC